MREIRDSKSGRKLTVDNSLLSALDHIHNKHIKADQRIGTQPLMVEALPLPSLAMRYLLQNEGLPLGMVYHVVGPPAVFKSTLAVEIGRWHRQCGGGIVICETETKPNPILRNSILGWDETAVKIRECTSVENWQQTIIDYVKGIKERCTEKMGPVAFIVDTYMAKMPQRLQELIIKRGFAERHFGEAAMLIGDWLSGYTALVKGWPFTLIGVNHLKQTTNPITGQPVYRTPGGQFLQHQNVIEIRVQRLKSENKMAGGMPYYESLLKLYTSKNSRGAQDKSIYVTLTLWNEVDEETNSVKAYGNFEWWRSSIEMLTDGTGMTNADKTVLLPLIKRVIDIKKRARGDYYWCEQLGVNQSDAMPAHDLGMMLEEKEDILVELYKILGIYRSPLYTVDRPEPIPKKPEAISKAADDEVVSAEIESEEDYVIDDGLEDKES